MNKQTPRGAGKGRYRSALSRRLLAQYLVALVLWAVGLTALGLLGWSVCNAIIWQPTNPIYWVLQWVREYVLLVYGGLLAGGWVAESYYFLSRPLRYLDEIVEGAKRLAQPGEALVELKNRFFVGDELETVTPKGSEKLVIEDIVIERTGEHVGVVNVPMERVRIPCGGKLQAGDMLRGPVRNRA